MSELETEESYGRRLGAVITEIRLARGFDTQQQLADAMSRHVSTIQRWETNGSMPNAWNIRELAEALTVDVATLLYPPDHLSPDVLDVSRAAAATVRREMVKRAARRKPKARPDA
ncbi:MAG TPA: helix-turn-helix transcriptional regulator [Candidatus Limnocylindrales bacterium]